MRVIRCSLPRSPEAPLVSSSPDIASDSWASRCKGQYVPGVGGTPGLGTQTKKCIPHIVTKSAMPPEFESWPALHCCCYLRNPTSQVFRPYERLYDSVTASFTFPLSKHPRMIHRNILLLVGAAAVTSSNMNIRCSAFLSGTRPAVPVRAVEIDDRRRGIHSSYPSGRPPSHTLRGEIGSEEFCTPGRCMSAVCNSEVT